MMSKRCLIQFIRHINIKGGHKICLRSIVTSTNAEVRQERNILFNKELERQKGLVARVEKIEVKYVGVPETCSLVMNKHLSTPFDCARHMSETVSNRAVLAEVNGVLWDMHRPLEDDCVLQFRTFRDDDPTELNKAFWRSCSFLMGMVIEKALKDEFYVELRSWPKPNVESGSFVYDVDLKIKNWAPSTEELRTLGLMMQKLSSQNLKFERLQVDESVALQMFEKNRFKKAQIPNIAKKMNNLTLYRVDDHIDISVGPMIGSPNHVGRVAIASVFPIESSGDGSTPLYRFQGVAIPAQLPLNIFVFRILEERAKKLNTSDLEPIQKRWNTDIYR